MDCIAVWDALACALEYPVAATPSACRVAAAALHAPETTPLRRALLELGDYLSDASVGEPEEHYTRLFDLNPVCALYVGWHLFGDTYARGALLAGLAGELNQQGVAHQHDLPDFLPTLLRLAARLAADDRVVLVHGVVLRGLEKIEAALANSAAPWARVLLGLRAFLEAVAPRGEVVVPSLRRPLEVVSC